MNNKTILFFIAGALIVSGCGASVKMNRIRKGTVPSVSISMVGDTAYIPQLKDYPIHKDTLLMKDDEGHQYFLMKTHTDRETGESTAHDYIRPATITAPFRSVAERNGQVELIFQVRVPAQMQDSRWQLRFYPDLYVMEDSLRLDPVIITGKEYRRAQLRGYQQYERFLSKIVSDTTKFINLGQLELFLKRYIPQVYAFKSDSTFVSDEVFASAYGVTEQMAVEHYTNKYARAKNWKRIRDKEKMRNKYIKAPIVTRGIRLDTIIVAGNGDFVYNYSQVINTRPRLRKAEVWLSGEIYDQEECIYTIPKKDSLVFYISSVSSFADNKERYLTRVIERRAEANTSSFVSFAQGSSFVNENLGNNSVEISKIKSILADLIENDTFVIDSIIVRSFASPEGRWATNKSLSIERSNAISAFFNNYISIYQDSLLKSKGFSVDENGAIIRNYPKRIPFISRPSGENWSMLDWLIDVDPVIDSLNKIAYRELASVVDFDTRENQMRTKPWYQYVSTHLYPRLRTVDMAFYLHRRGMVKDTVRTTVLDTVYMRGVQALKDMDYERALVDLYSYSDFNTAVVYTALNRNASAMAILSQLEETAEVNYMKAIIYSRMGDQQRAVECYLRSCKQNPSFVYRGKLDPEISTLIHIYGIGPDQIDGDNQY